MLGIFYDANSWFFQNPHARKPKSNPVLKIYGLLIHLRFEKLLKNILKYFKKLQIFFSGVQNLESRDLFKNGHENCVRPKFDFIEGFFKTRRP